VLNLISNAAKFTHNGEITLRLRRGMRVHGDWIEIAVADTGVGISAEGQKVLFNKFVQANARIASKYGGTGLGLSLSQNLCRLMGGEITVESRLGARRGRCAQGRLCGSVTWPHQRTQGEQEAHPHR
jgi:signal transduction histidine kinase